MLQWSLAGIGALISAGTDLAWHRIPNWVTMPLLAGGLLQAGWSGGAAGLLDGLAACVVLSLPFVLLFVLASGGAGDAKLMAALGACLGLVNGLVALVCVAAMGVIFAVGLALLRRRGREVALNVSGMAQGLLLTVFTRGRIEGTLSAGTSPSAMLTMPYGLAIFAGVGVAATGVLLWRM